MIFVPDPCMSRVIIFNRGCEMIGSFYSRSGSWDLSLTEGKEFNDFSLAERQMIENKQIELHV